MIGQRPRPFSLWPVQVAGAFGLLMALLLVPVSDEAVLLLPVVRGAPAAAIATRHGALIVARGPWQGSLVVRGSVGAMARPLLAAGVVPMRALPVLCGEVPA